MPDSRLDSFIGVVVAAGSATRFATETPKQFCRLGDSSVLQRAVRGLVAHPRVTGVIVVLSSDQVTGPRADEVRGWQGVLDVVEGGSSRAESVERGLEASRGTRYVLVHDAARPLASPELIDAVVSATLKYGAAVPALPVVDTVKQIGSDGWVVKTLNRSNLGLAQTPQGARTDWLLEALCNCRGRDDVTDEAAALERSGRPVFAVPGQRCNRKITNLADLTEARQSIEGVQMQLRVGTGFDVHRRDPSRRLILGGVEFPGEPGLEGHSDADVILHAAMDAILGAAALGDIGMMFPPEDAAWKDADSRTLARSVGDRVREAGFEIVNLDLTLLAERPKIRSRSVEMRQTIANCFQVDLDQVGLKATTLETMGALGRDEGVGCQAAALVRKRE